MGPGGPRRCFKSFLEAVPFILTEYEPVASHGHPMAARARKTQKTIYIYIYTQNLTKKKYIYIYIYKKQTNTKQIKTVAAFGRPGPALCLAGRAEAGGPEEPARPAGDLAGRAASANGQISTSADRLAVCKASI